ncbi:MAG: hypothetical protein WAM70_19965 [Pyrinomonadaceae bacterium]
MADQILRGFLCAFNLVGTSEPSRERTSAQNHLARRIIQALDIRANTYTAPEFA